MDWATVSDAEVVRACRAGEDAAWRELVERFSRYVFAIARAHRLGPSDAEDVFQETFARIYEHLGRLRSDEAIRPWIGQLTRRLCIDRLRAAVRDPVLDDAEEQGEVDRRLTAVDEAVSCRRRCARSRPTAARSSTGSSAATRATTPVLSRRA